MKKITLLLAQVVANFSFGQVAINELDADQTGTNTNGFYILGSDTVTGADIVV